MTNKSILIASMVFSAILTKAQTEKVIGISVSELGPGYEKPITSKITAKLQLGMYVTNQVSSESFTDAFFFFHGGANVSLRYYYNFNRRNDLGKNTNRNSANYFAFYNQYLSPPFYYAGSKSNYVDALGNSIDLGAELKKVAPRGVTSGIVWGMQRNYERRFSLDLNLGLGYSFEAQAVTAMATTSLGIWLGRLD